MERCEVCGREGKAADACRFEHGCSCWYGEPCKPKVTLLGRGKFRFSPEYLAANGGAIAGKDS